MMGFCSMYYIWSYSRIAPNLSAVSTISTRPDCEAVTAPLVADIDISDPSASPGTATAPIQRDDLHNAYVTDMVLSAFTISLSLSLLETYDTTKDASVFETLVKLFGFLGSVALSLFLDIKLAGTARQRILANNGAAPMEAATYGNRRSALDPEEAQMTGNGPSAPPPPYLEAVGSPHTPDESEPPPDYATLTSP